MHAIRRIALGDVLWLPIAILLLIVAARPGLPASHDSQCARWRSAFFAMPAQKLVIQASETRRLSLSVRLAATDEARWAGFQCATTDDIRRTVILFDFGKEMLGSFHMRNVPRPLDIAFAKESGRIFSILRMDPSPTKEYGPMGAFRYAVEARAGFFAERGIAPGHSLLMGKSN